ncbi:ABC-three component system middle component 6 [Gimesia maris]|uniref:ABC-three component system middle component 6 n=1 Tax=Gimesia maris TaxID=122 RepID=UPI003A8E30F6
MILPTKHLPPDRSLLGVGAEVLLLLDRPKTVSRLWKDIQQHRGESANRLPFDWFILSLNFLYTIDAIQMDRGRLTRQVVR